MFQNITNRIDFPTVGVDKNAIKNSRVTEYSIYGQDMLNTTDNLMSKICISSGVAINQPEINNCMNTSEAEGTIILNQLQSYKNPNYQFIAYNTTLNVTHYDGLAKWACEEKDNFVLQTEPVLVDAEVSKLPFKLRQD